MSDLISRKEIRNLILEEADEIVGGYDNSDSNSKVNALLDLVDRCYTINPGEWISVKDRLPENGIDVLCWYEYFRFGNYNQMYQTYGIGYQFNENWSGEVMKGQNCKVLFWMPLPQPPEEN